MTPSTGAPDAGTRHPAADTAPLVSVVIPTFNSETTVRRALTSVQAQSYENFEIVVADDASRDDTANVVAAIGDPRILWVESPEPSNTGPAATRNRALAKARGDYVAFLDSDDEWLPNKLARQVEYLEAHPDCSIVVTDADDVTPEGEVLWTEFGHSPPTEGDAAWRKLLKRSFIETSSVMTRMSLVRELGGFNQKLFVSQDQDLWIRLARRGKVGIIDEVHGKIHTVPTGHMIRNAMRQVDIMLPMIEGHVRDAGAELSAAERDDILGYRYETVGRSVFLSGAHMAGARLVLKSAAHGRSWIGNLFFLCHASPPGRFVKNAARWVCGSGKGGLA